MRPNRLRQIWDEGHAFTIAWLGVGNGFTAEVMARQGFDAVCVDMQHGLIDYNDAWPMFQAISQTETVPICRVPWNDPAMLMKVLDAGAYGVVVPLINTAEEAAAAVSACRYPPDGMRSFGPIRASTYGGPDYAAYANEEILVFGMIETKAGIANVDAICATPGLDGVYIGPADLSYALDLAPRADNPDPKHLETCNRILASAHAHGKRAGMHCASAAFAADAIGRGFDFVTVTSDVVCMSSAAKRQVEDLKAFLAGSAPATPAAGASSPY